MILLWDPCIKLKGNTKILAEVPEKSWTIVLGLLVYEGRTIPAGVVEKCLVNPD